MIAAMRYSLRDLLWLTIVIGLATALWLERRASPPVRFTGQPFDVAIAGEGFFLLTDPVTCGTLYTRFGSLSLDGDSRLILQSNGTEYVINPAIQIPSDATAVTVSPTGLVSVKRRQPELSAFGQIQLATFAKPDKLRKVAPAIYADTSESGPCSIFHPGQPQVGSLIQGAISKHY